MLAVAKTLKNPQRSADRNGHTMRSLSPEPARHDAKRAHWEAVEKGFVK